MNTRSLPYFIRTNAGNIVFNEQETSTTQYSKAMWDLRARKLLGESDESVLGVFEFNRVIHRSDQAIQTHGALIQQCLLLRRLQCSLQPCEELGVEDDLHLRIILGPTRLMGLLSTSK